MLTGKEIADKGLITGFLPENIQQQGIDLRVIRIDRVEGGGMIPKEGSTTKARVRKELLSETSNRWLLTPGYYEVTFEEGCNLDNRSGMSLKSRSSLVRCGGYIVSGHFDPGFHTDQIGGYMRVELPMEIEHGARLAQALIETSSVVENTYNGQWQGDIQRDETSKE